MKARPILMSAPMIRALLDGRKTQTRRILTPQPRPPVARWVAEDNWWMPKAVSDTIRQQFITTWPNATRCPYGQPGDLLWVREAWQLHSRATDLAKVVYRASEAASHSEFHELIPVSLIGNMQPKPFQQGWRSSIHMPRWASRLTLELTAVRVERLQDISEADAVAEGCFFTDYGQRCFHQGQGDIVTCPAKAEHHQQKPGWMWGATKSSDQCLSSARSAYGNLWNSINGPNSWAANPWVWVLEFRVHRQNVDALLAANAA